MSTQDFGAMDPNASLKQVINSLAELMDTLNFLLNGNLDVKNIRAQSITADRMNVKQLSAIAADLGTITAGIIYGAYIATANGTYPRIEFSSVNTLLSAMSDANNRVDMDTSVGSAPGMAWYVAGVAASYLQTGSFGMLLSTFAEDITFQPAKDLNISLGSGQNLVIGGFGAGQIGQSTTINYVKNVVAGVPTFGTMTYTKGILTSFT
jgi:hypothetical protein